MKGLRKYLSPFAPDISGASSVLYEMGGILVICDAGGCTGNVCGFDEPRWFLKRSCIFSAGLRDMDAIFGRDDKLVEKLKEASEQIEADFACVIGTPVPAVIGTDYHALKRMAEKKINLPILTVETTGMRQYDVGEEMAYLELFRTFAKEQKEAGPGMIGVIGATPLSVSDLSFKQKIEEKYPDKRIVCYGLGDGLDAVKHASTVEKNLVVSPSGLKVARELEKRFGSPYEVCYPPAEEMVNEFVRKEEFSEHVGESESVQKSESSEKSKCATKSESSDLGKILIVHQQALANELRKKIREQFPETDVTVASFFMMKPTLKEEGDISLKQEDDLLELAKEGGYTHVIADSMLKPMFDEKTVFFDIPHFACSGRLL